MVEIDAKVHDSGYNDASVMDSGSVLEDIKNSSVAMDCVENDRSSEYDTRLSGSRMHVESLFQDPEVEDLHEAARSVVIETANKALDIWAQRNNRTFSKASSGIQSKMWSFLLTNRRYWRGGRSGAQ